MNQLEESEYLSIYSWPFHGAFVLVWWIIKSRFLLNVSMSKVGESIERVNRAIMEEMGGRVKCLGTMEGMIK